MILLILTLISKINCLIMWRVNFAFKARGGGGAPQIFDVLGLDIFGSPGHLVSKIGSLTSQLSQRLSRYIKLGRFSAFLAICIGKSPKIGPRFLSSNNFLDHQMVHLMPNWISSFLSTISRNASTIFFNYVIIDMEIIYTFFL